MTKEQIAEYRDISKEMKEKVCACCTVSGRQRLEVFLAAPKKPCDGRLTLT